MSTTTGSLREQYIEALSAGYLDVYASAYAEAYTKASSYSVTTDAARANALAHSRATDAGLAYITACARGLADSRVEDATADAYARAYVGAERSDYIIDSEAYAVEFARAYGSIITTAEAYPHPDVVARALDAAGVADTQS